ncbi:MAG: hypothetical protein LIQ31_00595 [Planctomycetes bacterium]|nr:hypothetical protein [Planctomycetota bacterium]
MESSVVIGAWRAGRRCMPDSVFPSPDRGKREDIPVDAKMPAAGGYNPSERRYFHLEWVKQAQFIGTNEAVRKVRFFVKKIRQSLFPFRSDFRILTPTVPLIGKFREERFVRRRFFAAFMS